MSEIEKLTVLREKLVARRRSLVASMQRATPEQLTGRSISLIQSAIDAVNKAIEEERRSGSLHGAHREAARAS